ncbi:MAG: aminotransferase class I/II-fold pyridoxal phosphate-dependent enzyme [Bacteroidales bacterium]|nr:aminotransferase class I/II-fold pyridoxal phosphate-dependent enzyme [Bacteroidales bacterium]
MRSFGSDNNSGVHPQVMDAIMRANADHALAYGDDEWTLQAIADLKCTFGASAEPFFVFNGTGANVCAVRACCKPWESVFCASTAHIAVDECGAPGFLSGAAVKEIDTPNGKLTPDLLKPHLHGFGFEHHSQPKMVYISEVTELGTVYSTDEIRALADFVHGYGMYLHMDGARLANAAVSLQKTVKEITVDCGVDILSFGGTKNGCMMAESVIAFHPELAESLKYIRKQSAQLCSKMRYVAVQFSAYVKDDLLYRNAQNANAMAQLLRAELEKSGCSFTQATDANTLLLKMDPIVAEKLLEKHFFYVWDENTHEIRFVTSWDTTEADVRAIVDDYRAIVAEK